MRENRRKRVSKAKASKIHFNNRCLERVGYLINVNDVIKQIQCSSKVNLYNMTCLGRQSNRVSKWELKLEEKTFIVIYDRIRKCLITIYERGIKNERKFVNRNEVRAVAKTD